MDRGGVSAFLVKVERALPRFREADAMVAAGNGLDPPAAARRDQLLAEVETLGAVVLGSGLEDVRDWLGRPERDILDAKITRLREWQARIAAAG